MGPAIQIKGIRDSLLVSTGEGEWSELQEVLLCQIDEQVSFFKGARLALDVGNTILHAVEMSALRDKLSDREVSLWAVLSNSPTTEKTAQMLGLATRLPASQPEKSIRPLENNLPGEQAIMVRKTLRSGMKISYPGHVIVFGDVNPGAEVVAGGNILVWGRLRGVVHAGAEGDESAMVAALVIASTQLRIAGIAALSEGSTAKHQPEIARVSDGHVVVEPWIYKEGGR